MAKALTVTAIDNLKASVSRQEIPDGHTAGLFFVLQPTGKAGWAVRYRIKNTRTSRKLTIGGYPAISLKEARIRASKALIAVADGGDPAIEKQVQRRADKQTSHDTVKAVVDRFVERYLKAKKLRSWPETKRILEREVVAAWGSRPLADVTRKEVHVLLESVVDRGSPIMANRVLAALRKMCSWAVEHDVIASSPCDGVKAKSAEKSRDRFLDDDELRRVWHSCEAIGWPFAPLFRLLILTGARRDEVASMRWAEIDLDRKTWTLPQERAKNGLEHTVPLSTQAIAVLVGLPRIEGKAGYVFTTSGVTAVSGFSRAKERLDAAMAEHEGPPSPWTLHDLRRSFASGCAGIGINLPVIEKMLNHLSGSFGGIVGVYQRHSFAEEKRAAMDAWGRHIEAITGGEKSNVIELQAVRA